MATIRAAPGSTPFVVPATRAAETFPQDWLSQDAIPRRITVQGWSAVDPDCLVACYDDMPGVAFWIVTDPGNQGGRIIDGAPIAIGHPKRAHRAGTDPYPLSAAA